MPDRSTIPNLGRTNVDCRLQSASIWTSNLHPQRTSHERPWYPSGQRHCSTAKAWICCVSVGTAMSSTTSPKL
uniref:Uncharacterized protein n=1 Tax=Romanomermis culicivorax TaxID=13658 RepID=A0A915J8T3_ROMCU